MICSDWRSARAADPALSAAACRRAACRRATCARAVVARPASPRPAAESDVCVLMSCAEWRTAHVWMSSRISCTSFCDAARPAWLASGPMAGGRGGGHIGRPAMGDEASAREVAVASEGDPKPERASRLHRHPSTLTRNSAATCGWNHRSRRSAQ